MLDNGLEVLDDGLKVLDNSLEVFDGFEALTSFSRTGWLTRWVWSFENCKTVNLVVYSTTTS